MLRSLSIDFIHCHPRGWVFGQDLHFAFLSLLDYTFQNIAQNFTKVNVQQLNISHYPLLN